MFQRKLVALSLLYLLFLAVASGQDRVRSRTRTGNTLTRAPDVVVLPVNDLGMHCMDKEYSKLCILPPFNVVNVHVVLRNPFGLPTLLDATSAVLDIDAVKDAQGSINTHSYVKTDFWEHAPSLFGLPLNPGEGLTGFYMPGDAPVPGPQKLHYDTQHDWFSAEGIPITPWDDNDDENPYPLMRIRALEPLTGTVMGQTDVVVPVSRETTCSNCHHEPTGLPPSTGPIAWGVTDEAIDRLTRTNILNLHDHIEQTTLFKDRPILCASCHYSAALDLTGTGPTGPQVGKPAMSRTMHRFHGRLIDKNGDLLFPPDGSMKKTCYQCHPGEKTECFRGAMAAGGISCSNCHGSLLSVGGEYPLLPGGSIDGLNDGNPRRPWMDMPRCQSCHTGDEVSHLSGAQYNIGPDGLRLIQTYRNNDPSASPILAVNKRFAENDGTLFRFSKGHGGVSCESCHGSTHAIWPNPDPNANDNVTATQLQGHAGTVIECSTCHVPGTLPITTNGPHGMHNVMNQSFIDHKHENYFKADKNACRACHGVNLLGSPLGRVAADRVLKADGKTYYLAKGTEIRCNLCHSNPN